MGKYRKHTPKTLERKKLFVAAYFSHEFNGRQAAISVGILPASAATISGNFLRDPVVQQLIKAEMDNIVHRHRITVDKVVSELALIGFANIEDYTRGEGGDRVIDLSMATRDQLAAVSEITIDEQISSRDDERTVLSRRTKLRMHDKKGALVDLLRYLGGFEGKETPTNVDNRTVNIINVEMTAEEAAKAYQRMINAK